MSGPIRERIAFVGSNRRSLVIIVGCLVAVVACCLLAALAGGFFYLRSRSHAESPGVAYILDTSPRMSLETDGGTRLQVAQGVMSEIVRPANPRLTSGLRVFGSGAVSDSCQDTELVVPFRPANGAQIASELDGLHVGQTAESALAAAMVDAIQDLASTDGPQSLVVVTGGADSCNPQASELIAQEAERAGIHLQTFVVGFDVDEAESEAIKGMVSDTPGATYYDAPDEEALRQVLADIQSQVDTAGAGGETACNHPYFPLRPGARWTYSGEGISFALQVMSVNGDMENATASVASILDEATVNYEWTCSGGGLNFSQFGVISVDDLGGVGEFNIKNESGSTLLPADQLQPGASWSSEYTMTYSMGIAELDSLFSSHTVQQHTVGELETITTDAGTFEALPVTAEGTITFSGSFGEGSSPIESVIYYAEGVGIVRIETAGEGLGLQMDLTSYSVP